MAKKLSYVTCRIAPEYRDGVQCLADRLGCTVSHMTRSLLEREVASLGKPCVTGKTGRLVAASDRFHEKLREAARDGEIDSVERAELTTIEAEILSGLWNPPEAA